MEGKPGRLPAYSRSAGKPGDLVQSIAQPTRGGGDMESFSFPPSALAGTRLVGAFGIAVAPVPETAAIAAVPKSFGAMLAAISPRSGSFDRPRRDEVHHQKRSVDSCKCQWSSSHLIAPAWRLTRADAGAIAGIVAVRAKPTTIVTAEAGLFYATLAAIYPPVGSSRGSRGKHVRHKERGVYGD